MIAKLALEDGTVFTGTAIGAPGTRTGEVVFNTAMTGYQEVFTDPSYCGQIVTMTFPLQGNYGINPEDWEADRPYLAGVVLKALPPRPSNFRSRESLPEFLQRAGIVGLADLDTRALTRRIRTQGALRGALSTEILDDLELVHAARQAPAMVGADLVAQVAPAEVRPWTDNPGPASGASNRAASGQPRPGKPCPAPKIVVLDCGAKANIPRLLARSGADVLLAPASLSAGELLDWQPDALLISNGPGDPAAVTGTIETLRALLGRLPMFGICLGHQLLALALGARTYKLRFGHHGANLPVRNRCTGRVEITSQNHGFAVDPVSLERAGARLTHVNLNDNSVEGFAQPDLQLAAVQFHPEASPGPHDASHLLRRFVRSIGGPQPAASVLLE